MTNVEVMQFFLQLYSKLQYVALVLGAFVNLLITLLFCNVLKVSFITCQAKLQDLVTTKLIYEAGKVQ